MPAGSGGFARWSNTSGVGRRRSRSASSTICAPSTLNCTCQPRSATRFASGSIMSTLTTAVAGSPRVKNGDASCVRAELRDRIDRHPVVDGVVARLNDDDARRSDALLQQAVVRHRGIGRSRPRAGRHGKARGIVDVHVAVAGTLRSPELRRLGASRVRHLLAAAFPADCRCRCGYRHHRGSLDESTTCDHVDLPLPENPYKGWGTRWPTVKTPVSGAAYS